MSYLKHSHTASGSQSRAVIDGLDADIVTRLSTTILVAESAGRPFVYRKRSRADDATNKFPAQRVNATNGESMLTAAYGSGYYGSDGGSEVFAFHPGGALTVFGDGSTRLIQKDVTIRVFSALVTRAGKEQLGDKEKF